MVIRLAQSNVTNILIKGENLSLGTLKVKVKSLSPVRSLRPHGLYSPQAIPSMGFSRQEYWSGLPFPSPGDLPDLGTEPGSYAL